MTKLRASILAITVFLCPVALGQGADNAVILLYHHVSTKTPASTSVTPEVFEQHLQFLADGYAVIPLEQAVNSLKNNKPLPERAVVITFDDGYRNIYENAHPVLLKYEMPYTVFINPQMIGEYGYQLTWGQAIEMERNGARFANHTSRHRHLLERKNGEAPSEWLAGIEQDILDSEALLNDKLGYSSRYLAYPYGEFDTDIQNLISKLGMIGFGQHSGAIYSGSDFTALPRFPAAGIYANLDTLKAKINSLAMPVSSTTVLNPRMQQSSVGAFSFSLSGEDVMSMQMSCYYAGETLPVSTDDNTVTVTMEKPLPVGRSRVNCTAPGKTEPGRYYWYSQPWFVPGQDGKYPD